MNTRTTLGAISLPLLTSLLLGACAPAASDAGSSSDSPLATAPTLGSVQSFAVLGGSTVTNTGSSVIRGDLGVNPGLAITGFPPGLVVGGTTHAGDAVALQAQTDVVTAFNALGAQACDVDLTGKDLGGLTLVPGVYCFSSSAQLTGSLVLNAGGKPDAVFVFKTGSSLTSASNASVSVINGGSDCGVFWQVGSSATLGSGTVFVGSVLALASITLDTGAKLSGRALARTAAVTLDTNAVSLPICAAVGDAGADAAQQPDAALQDSGTSQEASTNDAGDDAPACCGCN
ncbi:MAG TPA: ice-binding family protein [Polyangiaceae bacterium]